MSDFSELKRQSESGETLKRIQRLMGFNLGTHKKTKLKRAGAGGSGTLLHADVAEKHAEKMAAEFEKRLAIIGSSARKRLKFLTVLHSCEEIEGEGVFEAVGRMERLLMRQLRKVGLWSRGAVEIEIVNVSLLQRIADQGDGETRKLDVLSKLLPETAQTKRRSSADRRFALVHCHVVVDLGEDHSANERRLRSLLERQECWQKSPYQIELKSLYTTQTVPQNLREIARYVTKGGNETLRFNPGFGRDESDELDAQIWRAGMSGEKVEDERGLSVGDVKALDRIWGTLMSRRSTGRGYVIATRSAGTEKDV